MKWNISYIELRMWNQVSYDLRSYESNVFLQTTLVSYRSANKFDCLVYEMFFTNWNLLSTVVFYRWFLSLNDVFLDLFAGVLLKQLRIMGNTKIILTHHSRLNFYSPTNKTFCTLLTYYSLLLCHYYNFFFIDCSYIKYYT